MASKGAGTILVVDDIPENVRSARGRPRPARVRGPHGDVGRGGPRPRRHRSAGSDPPRRRDAVDGRIRRVRVVTGRREDGGAPRDHGHIQHRSEKTKAIEAGADDFIPKPFNHDELLTRVRSLLRIKRYHDTIKAQATELQELNRTLEERVQSQVEELERLAATAAVLVSAARRLDRLLRRRLGPAQSPPSGRDALRGPARLDELRRRRRARGGDARARRVPRQDRRSREAVRRDGRDSSRATASSSSSTIRSRFPTPRCGPCGWRARCARRWRS